MVYTKLKGHLQNKINEIVQIMLGVVHDIVHDNFYFNFYFISRQIYSFFFKN